MSNFSRPMLSVVFTTPCVLRTHMRKSERGGKALASRQGRHRKNEKSWLFSFSVNVVIFKSAIVGFFVLTEPALLGGQGLSSPLGLPVIFSATFSKSGRYRDAMDPLPPLNYLAASRPSPTYAQFMDGFASECVRQTDELVSWKSAAMMTVSTFGFITVDAVAVSLIGRAVMPAVMRVGAIAMAAVAGYFLWGAVGCYRSGETRQSGVLAAQSLMAGVMALFCRFAPTDSMGINFPTGWTPKPQLASALSLEWTTIPLGRAVSAAAALPPWMIVFSSKLAGDGGGAAGRVATADDVARRMPAEFKRGDWQGWYQAGRSVFDDYLYGFKEGDRRERLYVLWNKFVDVARGLTRDGVVALRRAFLSLEGPDQEVLGPIFRPSFLSLESDKAVAGEIAAIGRLVAAHVTEGTPKVKALRALTLAEDNYLLEGRIDSVLALLKGVRKTAAGDSADNIVSAIDALIRRLETPR